MKRRHDDSERSRTSDPPFSRLFLIGKRGQFNDVEKLKANFTPYGNVKDVFVLMEKSMERDKGLAYVQFTKTSEAAKALDDLNGKSFLNDDRPIKVIPACSSGGKKEAGEETKMLRLFVKIPVEWDEDKFKSAFEEFGTVDKVKVLYDHRTNKPKGLGFVTYFKAYDAAMAFENCANSHKPVFADINRPESRDREDRGRSRHESPPRRDDYGFDQDPFPRYGRHDDRDSFGPPLRHHNDLLAWPSRHMGQMFPNSVMSPVADVPHNGNCRLGVRLSGNCSNEMLTRLFGIIPGLEFCDINTDPATGTAMALVKYSTPQSAAYAKSQLDMFEYPHMFPMRVDFVDPPMDTGPGASNDQIQQALKVLQAAGLNTKALAEQPRGGGAQLASGIELPPEKPLLPISTPHAERLFIVCEKSMSERALRSIFCRFGNLIEVFLLPGRNHGYAKFGSKDSASEAVRVLHRQDVFGCFMKVMIADPEKGPQ